MRERKRILGLGVQQPRERGAEIVVAVLEQVEEATPLAAHELRLDVEREGEEVLGVAATDSSPSPTSSSRSSANSRIVSSIA